MKNDSAALAENYGVAVRHFKLPITEGDGCLIEAAADKCKRSFATAPCYHAVELVRSAPVWSNGANGAASHQQSAWSRTKYRRPDAKWHTVCVTFEILFDIVRLITKATSQLLMRCHWQLACMSYPWNRRFALYARSCAVRQYHWSRL